MIPEEAVQRAGENFSRLNHIIFSTTKSIVNSFDNVVRLVTVSKNIHPKKSSSRKCMWNAYSFMFGMNQKTE